MSANNETLPIRVGLIALATDNPVTSDDIYGLAKVLVKK